MTNVRPGDLARVVMDPQEQGMLRMVVHVERAATDVEISLAGVTGRPAWIVLPLEHRKLKIPAGGNGDYRYAWAIIGKRFVCTDRVLRRIDPPAEDVDVDVSIDLEVVS